MINRTIDPISYNAGIEAAKKAVAKRRDDYVAEHGNYDPSTGVTEFPGNGDEYVGELDEIEELIGGLHRTEPQTAPDTTRAPLTRCPSCNLSWEFSPPAQCDGSDNFRCVECKAIYPGFVFRAAPADAERLALDDGALLNRLKTEAQLAKNGGHPILERSFNLAIDEIKKLREAAKGQLVVVNVAIAERQRAERNRDMWKGQCERQAEKLTALRAGGWREDMQS